jgi:hypothetical protein
VGCGRSGDTVSRLLHIYLPRNARARPLRLAAHPSSLPKHVRASSPRCVRPFTRGRASRTFVPPSSILSPSNAQFAAMEAVVASAARFLAQDTGEFADYAVRGAGGMASTGYRRRLFRISLALSSTRALPSRLSVVRPFWRSLLASLPAERPLALLRHPVPLLRRHPCHHHELPPPPQLARGLHGNVQGAWSARGERVPHAARRFLRGVSPQSRPTRRAGVCWLHPTRSRRRRGAGGTGTRARPPDTSNP